MGQPGSTQLPKPTKPPRKGPLSPRAPETVTYGPYWTMSKIPASLGGHCPVALPSLHWENEQGGRWLPIALRPPGGVPGSILQQLLYFAVYNAYIFAQIFEGKNKDVNYAWVA